MLACYKCSALRARRAQIGRLPRRPRRPDQHTTFAKWARGTGPMNSRVLSLSFHLPHPFVINIVRAPRAPASAFLSASKEMPLV